MVYAAIFLVFAVPAMAMFTYTRVADRREGYDRKAGMLPDP
ncbi:hypothetical protein [Nitrosomonas sp.]